MSVTDAILGLAAGAAGTAALNATTYLDMALRARPPSELPEKMVAEFAKMAGVDALAKPSSELSDAAKNRRMGVAALLGYTDGFGVGALFGALRPSMQDVSWFWAGIGLAAATMLMSEGLATAMEQTNPREWGVAGWLSDIVPRCLYGWVTALTFDRLKARNS